MFIIRRLKFTDAASVIVTLKISEWYRITRIQFAALLMNINTQRYISVNYTILMIS